MAWLHGLANLTRFAPIYRLWQAPFARDKFGPLLSRGDLAAARRVLDVGCGPGTNADYFAHAEYVGIDINPAYIAAARRCRRGEFRVADAATCRLDFDRPFDFILINSVLHHIDDAGVERILSRLPGQLTAAGSIHILELVLPAAPGVARLLAKADRGAYPRTPTAWRQRFRAAFEEVVFEPYRVSRFGVGLWDMVYFKGRARS